MAQDDQSAVIAFLSDPARLGLGPVEIIETHGSMVFLTKDRAYKLKKAVHYSYLDYSTLPLRQDACAKEMAINARFAPHLYLAARPITRDAAGTLALGGAGEPVDWVVEMRRFSQEDQLDRMAERGALTQPLIRDLADRIADAHDHAPRHTDFGGADALQVVYDKSLADLRSFAAHGAPNALPRGLVEEWARQAQEVLRRHAPLLDQRRAEGKVRACHGDLHLANICLTDDAPTLFDAIEFDPAISNIDVLYDLAFLLMDLHCRGMAREANQTLNRYLDVRDESDGLAALPFLMSLRAAIRAQVIFAASLNSHDPASADAKRAQSRDYLREAAALLRPVEPRLIAVGGFSGSGKSTLAQNLAPSIGRAPGARVVRSDVLRKRAFGAKPETKLPAEAYSPEAHQKTYELLTSEIVRCLAAGQGVIADAVFGRREEREAISSAAMTSHVRLSALWLDAPLTTMEQRIDARRGDASDATIPVLRSQTATADVPQDWTRIDAAEGPQKTLAAALKVLAQSERESESG